MANEASVLVQPSDVAVRAISGLFNQRRRPTGSEIVAYLVEDLSILKCTPIEVDCLSGWWIVHAAVDWMADDEKPASYRFQEVTPFLRSGKDDDCRKEILVSVLARLAMTSAGNSRVWIKSEAVAMPDDVSSFLRRHPTGRTLCFQMP